MCPPGLEGGGGVLAVVLPHAGVPEVAGGVWWSWAEVPGPVLCWGVPVVRGLIVLLEGGGMGPGVWGPKGGREGRVRNRRRRAMEVTRGPRSRGDVGVLGEGDRGMTMGGSSASGDRRASSRVL